MTKPVAVAKHGKSKEKKAKKVSAGSPNSVDAWDERSLLNFRCYSKGHSMVCFRLVGMYVEKIESFVVYSDFWSR